MLIPGAIALLGGFRWHVAEDGKSALALVTPKQVVFLQELFLAADIDCGPTGVAHKLGTLYGANEEVIRRLVAFEATRFLARTGPAPRRREIENARPEGVEPGAWTLAVLGAKVRGEVCQKDGPGHAGELLHGHGLVPATRPLRVYVASSWRCDRQPAVVEAIREAGLEVYDFRHPAAGENGFSWREIVPDPSRLRDPQVYRTVLGHPIAWRGFSRDMNALRACDACVLVLPCGRSAHLELGWAAGAGKRTIVLLDAPISEPELMYLACDAVCVSIDEVLAELGHKTVVSDIDAGGAP